MRVLVMGSLNYDFVYEVDHIHRLEKQLNPYPWEPIMAARD